MALHDHSVHRRSVHPWGIPSGVPDWVGPVAVLAVATFLAILALGTMGEGNRLGETGEYTPPAAQRTMIMAPWPR